MQDRRPAIEKLLIEAAQLHDRGEYRQAYQCAGDALSLVREHALSGPTSAKAYIYSARSAYYLSLFDESLEHLDRLESDIPAELAVEASIIRANVMRRLGRYREGLHIIDNYEIDTGIELPPRLIAERLLTRGACLYYIGNLEKARENLEAALGLATHSSDIKSRARVLVMLGLLARSMGFMGKAVDYFSRGRELCRTEGDSYGEAAALLNMSIALYHSGKFDSAGKTVSKARSLFARVEWDLGICRSFLLAGNICRRKGDYSEAVSYYERAERVALKSGFTRERSLVLQYLSAVHLVLKETCKARGLLLESLQIASEIAPEGDLAIETLRRLGEVSIEAGEPCEAEVYLSKALKLAGDSGERLEAGLILRSLGRIRYVEGDAAGGKERFIEAIKEIRNSDCRYQLARTHLLFAELLIDRTGPAEEKDLDEAIRSLTEAGFLFAGTDDCFYRSKTDRLLKGLLVTGRKSGIVPGRQGMAAQVITVEHSTEYMIAEHFAAVSEHMLDVWRKIQFASRFLRPVLITGETGTGKELVARLIHKAGERSHRPFVAVNCAAIPDHLFESEFFGHRKGCFTGASTDRKGLFEEAHGGTIFLDEVGELSALQQVKLLRVLQERRVRRIGENIERAIDVRIISATNRDLEKMIEESSFREDFYYRINSEQLHIEPLRKRPEDILPLMSWRLCGNGNGRGDKLRIEHAALKYMQEYHWPGNVRELISVVDRIAHMNDSGIITVDMLPEKIRGGMVTDADLTDTGGSGRSDPDNIRVKLSKVMKICKGNKSAAARWLGISRGTLYKELRRAGLSHYIR